MPRTFAALVVVGFLAIVPSAEARCGAERWAIKTGTDSGAQSVDLGTVNSTDIDTMRNWPAPTRPPPHRIAPYEFKVWTVTATLTAYKFEDDPNTGDSDYHLVLSDAAGRTIIAEIPSPSCVSDSSPFRAGIAAARAAFDSKFQATGQFQSTNTSVKVTGIGFFDFQHGQNGVAPNAVELHPVIDIQFTP